MPSHDFVQNFEYLNHLKVSPNAYYSYYRFSDDMRKQIENQFKTGDPSQIVLFKDQKPLFDEYILNGKVKHILLEVYKGNLENFVLLYTNFKENKRYDYCQLMCVCLYNQKSLKDQPLVGKLILDELNSFKEESGEESLKSLSQVISWLAVTLVLSDLLKPVQPTHFDQYDERSFLLTQSELFTGGINVENLDFLS